MSLQVKFCHRLLEENICSPTGYQICKSTCTSSSNDWFLTFPKLTLPPLIHSLFTISTLPILLFCTINPYHLIFTAIIATCTKFHLSNVPSNNASSRWLSQWLYTLCPPCCHLLLHITAHSKQVLCVSQSPAISSLLDSVLIFPALPPWQLSIWCILSFLAFAFGIR